jgi:hypothetical protein
MSTAEKSVYLKHCLKTIGVQSPQLAYFINKSLAMEKNNRALIRKGEQLQNKLGRLQAEALSLLLDS